MDLTKRHNVFLLITFMFVLLAIAAVLAVNGHLIFGPFGVTMVAYEALAA